jgi:hypothetical protein
VSASRNRIHLDVEDFEAGALRTLSNSGFRGHENRSRWPHPALESRLLPGTSGRGDGRAARGGVQSVQVDRKIPLTGKLDEITALRLEQVRGD